MKGTSKIKRKKLIEIVRASCLEVEINGFESQYVFCLV